MIPTIPGMLRSLFFSTVLSTELGFLRFSTRLPFILKRFRRRLRGLIPLIPAVDLANKASILAINGELKLASHTFLHPCGWTGGATVGLQPMTNAHAEDPIYISQQPRSVFTEINLAADDQELSVHNSN